MVASYLRKVQHFITEKALPNCFVPHHHNKSQVVSGVSLKQSEGCGGYEGIMRPLVQSDELDDFSSLATEEGSEFDAFVDAQIALNRVEGTD